MSFLPSGKRGEMLALLVRLIETVHLREKGNGWRRRIVVGFALVHCGYNEAYLGLDLEVFILTR